MDVADGSKNEATNMGAELLVDDIYASVGYDRKVTEGTCGGYQAVPEPIDKRDERLGWLQFLIIFDSPLL